MSEKLAAILQKMYKGYCHEGIGISYFSKFLPDLKNYQFSEILAFQGKKYNYNYIFEFLLSTPSLWSSFTDSDWLEVMQAMNPRPNPLPIIDLDHGDFADIHFLFKYLRVNSIEVFLRQNNFSISDKNHLISYCFRNLNSLLLDEIDLESLDGEYLMAKEELWQIQARLTANGMFSIVDFEDWEEVRDYLRTERNLLNLPQN